MAISIGSHEFHGPFFHHARDGCAELEAKSGVFVVLGGTHRSEWTVLDVGESANISECVKTHTCKGDWLKRAHRGVAIAALYVPEGQRLQVARQLSDQYVS